MRPTRRKDSATIFWSGKARRRASAICTTAGVSSTLPRRRHGSCRPAADSFSARQCRCSLRYERGHSRGDEDVEFSPDDPDLFAKLAAAPGDALLDAARPLNQRGVLVSKGERSLERLRLLLLRLSVVRNRE